MFQASLTVMKASDANGDTSKRDVSGLFFQDYFKYLYMEIILRKFRGGSSKSDDKSKFSYSGLSRQKISTSNYAE